MKRILLAFIIFVVMPGCAPVPQRFLSQEQDTAMREQCEATGCVVVPVPLMQQILNRLRGQGA